MSDIRVPELSVVIPVFNEEQSVGPLHAEIEQALADFDYEVLYIDDGSTDKSFSVLTDIQKKCPRVRLVKFRRNFGQTAAMSAGFKYARGKIIIPMDADGQNDPADIPKLISRLNEGYDIVSGWRKERKDNAVTRTLPSRIANWMIGKITGIRLHDYGCTLKAYRAESLKPIRLYGDMHRFIPALARWGGEKVVEMVVNHRPRTTGKTKYGLSRTFKVVLLIISLMLMMASIQFVLMGLLAEIMVRTYHESQDRPIYVIDKVIEPENQSSQSA
ncbi:MAG: glycosyltransferase family 2 protein [Planctomycetota bacterium]|jgi:glycosyltransferase involved in cell wall biosynthesis